MQLMTNDTQPSHEKDSFRRLSDLACAGDLDGLRALVAEGFDLSSLSPLGEASLETVLDDLYHAPEAPRYAVVQELLRLGADARQRDTDGLGPLFTAVLAMDTEMLRILLDAGADPNTEKMDSAVESLYDWAVFDYRYEIWNLDLPEEPTDSDRASDDAWLTFLDEMAVRFGKRRPDHLRLLRDRGARSMEELNELPGSPWFGSQDQYRNRFEIRVADRTLAELRKGNGIVRVDTTILVDGEEVEPAQTVDVIALVDSIRHSGRFEIFVCGCVTPRSCGAAFHSVAVTHWYSRIVRWDLHWPQYIYGEDDPYDGSFGPEKDLTYSFSRAQMLCALRDYFATLRALAAEHRQRIEWSIHGQSIGEVLELESVVAAEIRDG